MEVDELRSRIIDQQIRNFLTFETYSFLVNSKRSNTERLRTCD